MQLHFCCCLIGQVGGGEAEEEELVSLLHVQVGHHDPVPLEGWRGIVADGEEKWRTLFEIIEFQNSYFG